MAFFLIIVGSISVLNAGWWWWADRRVRTLPRPRRWRILIGGFSAVQIAMFFWLLLARSPLAWPELPRWLLGWAYLWHMIVLPGGAAVAGVTTLIGFALSRLDRPSGPGAPGRAPGLTRRELLGAAVAVGVPALSAGAAVRGYIQNGELRLREIDVSIPGLPEGLDGAVISHVTDIHVGRFTRGRSLDRIVELSNSLRPDAVMMSGDLIDYSLSDLADGIAVVRRLEAPAGVFTCEGNHDLFQDAREFERRVRDAGIPLLRNEAIDLTIRGVPVRVLGLKWAPEREQQRARLEANMRAVEALLDPSRFQILLAHHPHAFDGAQRLGIPLTLAGHTHGGQLNLSSRLGFGPALYRYWSGLYSAGDARCVVSNGAGNWFPLRINAPAEIVKITLRRAGVPTPARA